MKVLRIWQGQARHLVHLISYLACMNPTQQCFIEISAPLFLIWLPSNVHPSRWQMITERLGPRQP